jgi:multiple sugar transport system substrate-binding protein
LETAIVEFETLYPNVTVVLEEVLGTGDDYTIKTSLLLQSDDTIDVLIVDSFLLGGFVAADYLAPIPTDEWPEYDQQFSGKVKEGATVDGNVYAISFSTDTRGLYYNTTVFENAGVATSWAPKSWAELMDMIEQLHDADVPYPIWMNASVAHGEGTTMQTFEMFLGGTEDWIYEDGKWVVKAPGIVDTLEFIQDLYEMGIYDSTELAVMMEANAWQTIDPLMIASEEVGILLDGNWKGAAFADYTDVIKVTPMPNQAGDGFSSMSGGWTLTIPALSQQQDLGMDLIKVVANKENMVNCCRLSGDMSPRADVANDPRYIEPNPLRAEMSAYTEFTKFRPGH